MENTKKTYQGLRLLLSTSPFSPCDSRRYDVHYNSTTTNTLQSNSPIRFPFPFPFRYFSYGLRSFSVLLDLDFLSPYITFFTFPSISTDNHLLIKPCILSPYPHHAYCTLSQVYVSVTCFRFAPLTCVTMMQLPITSPVSFSDFSPTLRPPLQRSSNRSSY